MKKVMIVTLALILSLTLVPISSACTIKQVFENIVISSGIEEDTSEPLDENTEFEASAEHIYATIKFSGVRGGDNWRFKWTNLDTGEIVLDEESRYDMDQEEKYMEGIVETDIHPLDESSPIPAGDYKVEFYNNGELIKTTTFKVNSPEVSIIEVLLANQVDQNYVPISVTQEFKSNETVYACVQVNYQTTGTFLKAQWKSSTDELIKETSIELTEFSSPSYVTFWFPSETETLDAGSYKVEIYLNDILYGSFDFNVTEEVAETNVTFDQGNEYSGTDFGFNIAIPDNWTYEENKTEQDVSLIIVPPSLDMAVRLQFSAVDPEPYSPFGDFADNDSESFAEQQNWTFVEKNETDSTLLNGTPCKEYSYLYIDSDDVNWIMGYCFTENNDVLYILIIIADQVNSSIAIDAYIGILNSLIFV